MILILLALLVLLMYLYINNTRKNEKKVEVEKKPDVNWYMNKMSDIFFKRKLVVDNNDPKKEIVLYFTGEHYRKWEHMVYKCLRYWWTIPEIMEYIYNNFKKNPN